MAMRPDEWLEEGKSGYAWAGITENLRKPKALRHAFKVEAGQKGIPLDIVQRRLGNARIETTAINASARRAISRERLGVHWSRAIPEPSILPL